MEKVVDDVEEQGETEGSPGDAEGPGESGAEDGVWLSVSVSDGDRLLVSQRLHDRHGHTGTQSQVSDPLGHLT